MILLLLLTLTANAAMKPVCSASSPQLKKVLQTYATAYYQADKNTLKRLTTDSFWKELEAVLPKANKTKVKTTLVEASSKEGTCYVLWKQSPAKESNSDNHPTWFRLQQANQSWKIAGVLAEGPDLP